MSLLKLRNRPSLTMPNAPAFKSPALHRRIGVLVARRIADRDRQIASVDFDVLSPTTPDRLKSTGPASAPPDLNSSGPLSGT